jgi:uncharacterized membrane protein
MKKLFTILVILAFTNFVSAQNPSKVNLTIKKHSTKKIDFELKNVSSDTIGIEDFRGLFKNKKFIISNYTIYNDTLILNWSSNKNVLQSAHSVDFQIDGKKKESTIKFRPNEKLAISIRLYKKDFDKIKNLSIKLNSADSLSVKLN